MVHKERYFSSWLTTLQFDHLRGVYYYTISAMSISKLRLRFLVIGGGLAGVSAISKGLKRNA